MLETLTSVHHKKYKLDDYGVFHKLQRYKRHLEKESPKHRYCTAIGCGSYMRSAKHLIEHQLSCHPQDVVLRVEIFGSENASELNKVSERINFVVECHFPTTRFKRTFDFKETERLKIHILLNAIYC